MGFGLLSLLTWLPIAGGLLVLIIGDRGIKAGRWVALATAVVVFGASIPLWIGFDPATFEYQFVEQLPWIPALHSTYYLGVDGISLPLILLTTFITDSRGHRRVDGDRVAAGAVLRRLPHHGRPDDRRVLRARRPAVLLLLGSDAHPDVPHHRRVGRSAARVRDAQVLPVHVPRQRVHAGRADLHVSEDAATTASRRSTTCRCRRWSSAGSSSPSCWPSRSRSRWCRCTRGCRMRTSRRPPAARWCWPPSC